MFRYIQQALDRFDHPLLVSLYVTAVVFALLGLAFELADIRPLAAAFFAVYAIFAATLATTGYALLFASLWISRLTDRQAPA